ncbi:unnamed protein product [Acanthoscelides obtectus]|uniref:Uncharacterized protein n=1 Tax=Acanthoscelides obtectus TaxID=200917 RepID=A0A9P0JGK4_ACAOB|nr:unnamed protein product [Acanthoscelides obtectus]CAK1649925.1 hypothetical protein AOBTE_LOCUS16495 [Acanthoscelides obtectus]
MRGKKILEMCQAASLSSTTSQGSV